MLRDLAVVVVTTLVITPIGLWLQQGGRRARLRRRITAEIELAEKLNGYPNHQARLRERILRLLEVYEPYPRRDVKSFDKPSWAWVRSGWFTRDSVPRTLFANLFVALFPSVASVIVFPDIPTWGLAIIAVVFVLLLNLGQALAAWASEADAV
jgi:hypothetical protein